MAGLTQVSQQAALDFLFPVSGATSHIMYSVNGTSEWAGLARTAVGATGWAAATAATPSVKSNNAVLLSAAATAAGTVTHYAIITAGAGGTQQTDWQAVGTSRALSIGDKVEWAIGQAQVTMD